MALCHRQIRGQARRDMLQERNQIQGRKLPARAANSDQMKEQYSTG